MTFVPSPDHLRFYMAALNGEAAPAPTRRSRPAREVAAALLESVLQWVAKDAVRVAWSGVLQTT
jgi:hypothetical protein